MSKKITLGGDRLGGGEKMTTVLDGYGNSTHNLSYAWKSSMTVGTLVPFMTELMTNGDHCTVDLETMIRTQPTMMAMYGTFKLQIDIFKCPIRYYNKVLHNNKKGIGMQMDKVLFPQIKLYSKNPDIDSFKGFNAQQVATNSLMSYLGVRGLGHSTEGEELQRDFNAIPLLAYYDIYANYYANLQEKIGGVCTAKSITEGLEITMVLNSQTGEDLTRVATQVSTQFNEVIATVAYNQPAIAVKFSDNISINDINIYDVLQITMLVDGEQQIQIVNQPLIWYLNNDYLIIDRYQFGRLNLSGGSGLPGNATIVSTQQYPALGINSAVIVVKDDMPTVTVFDIENIDEMREKILEHSQSSSFMINDFAKYPYKSNCERIHNSSGTFINGAQSWKFAGLCVRTYLSDRFNNWLSTEWIDGVNGVNDQSKIDVSSGYLTMDSLNLQQKIYNLLNRVALSGGSYRDWQESVWSRRGIGELEIPEWVGGLSSEIVFDEVVSTADAGSENPLGSLGGRGKQIGSNKNKISIHANEPMFIMGIVSIVPRLDYSQGNKWWSRLQNMNELHKPELDGIGFQDLLTDEFAAVDTELNAQGMPKYNSVGKQLAWTEYTTNENQAYGNFANGEYEDYMILGRMYSYDDNYKLMDATTYIDPTLYSHNFAQTDMKSENFWLQIGVDMKMTRVMSTKQIPQL